MIEQIWLEFAELYRLLSLIPEEKFRVADVWGKSPAWYAVYFEGVANYFVNIGLDLKGKKGKEIQEKFNSLEWNSCLPNDPKKAILDFMELAFEGLKAKILMTSDIRLSLPYDNAQLTRKSDESAASGIVELIDLMAFTRSRISAQFPHPVHPV
ncbi:hypothetical protein GCM10017783_19670 [Deinococcus piscis]|uniref:Uncharacterized protein n=1 Tax=Deinococcus piscis TaxID=394230 RepID=A0ABQ3KBE5_9DEIO|nr:hypothetical protein GCM10017783_19670 [Deinococcus piscis]